VSAVRGIWAAALTPITADLRPDDGRAVAYYRDLLESGCDGINVLGTTGEAMSFSAAQRERSMESVASSGLPMARVMVGTGAASLDDAVRLTRCAIGCSFAAALVMPPFFFREVAEAGMLAFFDALLARADAPPKSVLLYHFPRMSGIALDADAIDRLIAEFGDRIFGMKDSSNDARLQAEIASRHPGFVILPGSESGLLEAKARGAAGCISGSVALWPQLAKRVFESGDERAARELKRRRAAFDGVPLVPAMKYLTASMRNDPEWERPMPPQQALSVAERDGLDALRLEEAQPS
jgi:4-hydroxy-tetrahydrodipicolinate synthase